MAFVRDAWNRYGKKSTVVQALALETQVSLKVLHLTPPRVVGGLAICTEVEDYKGQYVLCNCID
jgi:hypothetical protein